MGWTAFKGNDNIELGVVAGTSKGTMVATNSPKFGKLPKNLILTTLSPSVLNASTTHPPIHPLLAPIQNPEPSTPASISNTPSRNTTKRNRKADTKENELEEMHSELMTLLTSINNNISKLAGSANVLVHFLSRNRNE